MTYVQDGSGCSQSLQGIPVYNILQVSESLTGRLPIKHLYENNLGSLLPSPSYLLVKRLMDTIIVFFTIPITIPLAMLIGIAIKWESRHSNSMMLFKQQRIGQGGKLFTMYKFRSMIVSAEALGAQMASENDMRVTKFGSFIRKTRLDELPQFINVLKGDMSLIGPRPEQLSFVKQFNETIPFYRYRHIVSLEYLVGHKSCMAILVMKMRLRSSLSMTFFISKIFL